MSNGLWERAIDANSRPINSLLWVGGGGCVDFTMEIGRFDLRETSTICLVIEFRMDYRTRRGFGATKK
jgi:hypothetical protein